VPWNLDSPWNLLLVCLLSGVLLPLPEDVILLTAGWSIRQGRMEWLPTFLSAWVGVFLRDTLYFSIGYYLEEWLEKRPLGARLLRSHSVQRARDLFDRNGRGMLLLARFAIGMRPPLYLVAGLVGHSYRSFWLSDSIGLLLTVPLCLGLGWYFGEDAARTLESLMGHQRILLAVLIVGIGGRWIWKWRSRRKALARAMGER
jgi:membrane protein DedA with SNARE-associated domain